jgi:Methylamine utilisation protein MauE
VPVSELDLTRDLAYSLQLSLGCVFLLAALPKLSRPGVFTRTIAEYRLVPRPIAGAVALVVIATECFLAFAFVTGWMTPAALLLAATTLLAFSAAVAINLRRGRRISCGCFGGESERISGRSLVRLSMLLAAVLLLAVVPASRVTLATLPESGPSALAYLVEVGGVALFLVLAGAWLLSLPELVFTLRQLRPERRAGTT